MSTTITSPPINGVITGPVTLRFPGIETPTTQPAPQAGLTEVTTADLEGWDTAFGIQVQYVNQAIAASNASPTQFTQTDSTIPATLAGSFGAWQISNGGSGQLIEMTVPIPTAQLTYGGNTETLSNLDAIILVNLMYVAQTSGPGQNLVVVPNTSAEPTVTIRNVVQAGTSNPADPNALKQAIIQALLTEWFNANINSFAYVFNTVNLNQQIDTGWSWVIPTAVSYAFAPDPGGNINLATFAVLCMTENRPMPSGYVSNGIIPDATQAGFVISSGLYLQSLVLPNLPGMFINASGSDFIYDPSGDGQIRNVNELTMTPVSMNGSERETTIPVGDFILTMSGSEIAIQILNATLTYSPGITITISYTSYYQILLQPQSAGTKTIIFQTSTVAGHTEPKVVPVVNVSTGVQIAEAVAGVIAAGIGAAIGFGGPFQTVAFNIITAVIVSAVLTAIVVSPEWMKITAEQKWDELPTIDLLITNTTSPVNWPGGSNFQPTTALLNDAFVIGGTMFA